VRPMLLPVLLVACIESGVAPHQDPAPAPPPAQPPPYDPSAPIAHAGEGFSGAPLSFLQLDGSASYDPSGLPIVPHWRIAQTPPGSSAELDQLDSFEPLFYADIAGLYEIELRVINSEGTWSQQPDTVRVLVVPSDQVYVQLTWDAAVDLDLHLLPVGASIFHPDGCSWCNPNPDWGVIGDPRDDPSLDADAIHGYGPETVTIPEPSPGAFIATIHYYGQGGDRRCQAAGCPETTATLELYIDGVRVHRMQQVLGQAGEVFEALQVDWPGGTWTERRRMSMTQRHLCVE